MAQRPRDTFGYLLRHGSLTTLEIERKAYAASGRADRLPALARKGTTPWVFPYCLRDLEGR